jgi:SAM-dependent methyltransferase
MNHKYVRNHNDLLQILDDIVNDPSEYWNTIYQERPKYMSFLTESPYENLVSYFKNNVIQSGKALELGCGEGRNSFYMARQGCEVDAIDISNEAINNALEKAKSKNVEINFLCKNVFELEVSKKTYDLVYDSGLMHHLLPHRRIQYIELLNDVLKAKGYFGLICFAPGFKSIGGAEEISDKDVYKERSILGGMAFSKEKLQYIMSEYFELIEIRYMKDYEESSEFFGKPFLWTSLWQKK